MTHWYSRTPEDFLNKVNPPFLPQTTGDYKERNGLVWDIRDDKWVDMYWKLTQTAVDAYGRPGAGLLHTIGLGERLCYTNRADNLKLKMLALDKFLKRAHRFPRRRPVSAFLRDIANALRTAQFSALGPANHNPSFLLIRSRSACASRISFSCVVNSPRSSSASAVQRSSMS